MTVTELPPTAIAHAGALVDTIDLSMVRTKLADPDEGKGWDATTLDIAEGEYRKYLALCLAYPQETIVPCKIVDDVWHQHILDTRAYRDDCARVFGFFYDHFPYFGMRDAADSAALRSAYDRTIELYEINFGVPPVGTWRTVEGARCRTACKPVKCR